MLPKFDRNQHELKMRSDEARAKFMDSVEGAVAEVGNWSLLMTYLGSEIMLDKMRDHGQKRFDSTYLKVNFLPNAQRPASTAHKIYCNLLEALIARSYTTPALETMHRS